MAFPDAIRTARPALALFALIAPQPSYAGPIQRPDQIRVKTMLDIRNDRLVRQQWDLSCGAAAVATMLTFQLGDPVSERQAALGMLRTGNARLARARLGFSLLDLKRFAASLGFSAAGYGNLSIDELLAMAPAIVPIRVHNFGHFVVIRGQRGDRVLLGDPAFGNRTMTTDAFLRAWTSHIGFVVTRPGELHPPNRMGTPAELFPVPSGSAVRAADTDLRVKG